MVVLQLRLKKKKKKNQASPLLHKTYMRFAKEVWEQPEALAPQIVHLISKLILDSGSSQPGIVGFNAACKAKTTGVW